MKKHATKIECPKCGSKIDVSELLHRQVDQELRKEYDDELAKARKGFEKQRDTLTKKEEELEAEKKKQAELVTGAVQEQLKKERKAQEKAIKAEVKKEQAEGLKVLKDELEEKSKEVRELNKTKSELERLQREKDELQEKMAAEAEKKLTATLKEEREKIRRAEEEKQQLKVAEKEQVIAQLNEQLKEAQRKAEQGSTQLQGEVQETAIEGWLRDQFPLDTVEEIKKGAKGADCLQVVNTRAWKNCGKIYYESKRTKSFQPAWIAKFKDDIREKGAHIGVLVTESMPAGMARMGMMDGIVVCTFDVFKGLCAVLRERIISVYAATAAQENKGEKMTMLYDFLTGNEFRGQIEAIVEGFTQMQSDLETEKRAMASIWKKRQKAIEKVLLSTGQMHGAIRGIAGSSVAPVKMLELPTDEDG
jgi:hypothetical protein